MILPSKTTCECQLVWKITELHAMKSNQAIAILILAISILLGYLLAQRMGWIHQSNSIEISKDSSGIALQIDDKLANGKSSCQKYQFIELQFIGSLGENLRILTKCKLSDDKKSIDAFSIPFQHIFTFPPQTGEFTVISETKIYISNHKSKWSKKWKLSTFYFLNSVEDRLIVEDKKLILDVENLLEAAANSR